MQKLYQLTAVDLRRATQAGSSRAVTIRTMTLPSIEFVTAEHNPGGGVMAANFVMPRLAALEPKFDGRGVDTDIFTGLGVAERWTFAASYRLQQPGGGKVVPARGIIEGAISQWEPDQSDPTEFQGCTHSFHQVTHFEFHLDDEELFYVDFFERVMRRGGVDLFADERKALGA